MSRTITWKIHLSSNPEQVYWYLSTSQGRTKYWAERANEIKGAIHFVFSNGERYMSKILEAIPHSSFTIEYFDSTVTFNIAADGKSGTDLQVVNSGVSEADYLENYSGWVSVLLALKAAADFNIDLRNHDSQKCWDQGFVDN